MASENDCKVPGWAYADGGKAIVRRYTFKNFKQALAFVDQVGEIAEKSGHHPDIRFGWGYAEILLTTHDSGGVTAKDYQLAAEINEII